MRSESFPGGEVAKNLPANAGEKKKRCKFDSWIRKIHWSRKWQPNPVFLTGKMYGQSSLASYSPWSHKRVGHDLMSENDIKTRIELEMNR